MAIDVTVLRVFTDADGQVRQSARRRRRQHRASPPIDSGSPPNWVTAKRYSSICRSRVRTPRTPGSSPRPPSCRSPDIRRSARRGGCATAALRSTPCRCPPGIVQVSYDGDLTVVRARAEWAPEFAIYDLTSVDELLRRRPGRLPRRRRALPVDVDSTGTTAHIRSRMFARRARRARGRGDRRGGGSHHRLPQPRPRPSSRARDRIIKTQWSPDGWVRVAGRVVDDGARQID